MSKNFQTNCQNIVICNKNPWHHTYPNSSRVIVGIPHHSVLRKQCYWGLQWNFSVSARPFLPVNKDHKTSYEGDKKSVIGQIRGHQQRQHSQFWWCHRCLYKANYRYLSILFLKENIFSALQNFDTFCNTSPVEIYCLNQYWMINGPYKILVNGTEKLPCGKEGDEVGVINCSGDDSKLYTSKLYVR